jgi:hypothetical protein
MLERKLILSDKVKKGLQARLRAINKKSTQTQFLTPNEVASGGILENAYFFYSLLSDDAGHPSLRSLQRYLIQFEEPGRTVLEVNCDPPPKESEIVETLAFACNAVIGACGGVNDILGGTPAGQELGKIADEYNALWDSTKCGIAEPNAEADALEAR